MWHNKKSLMRLILIYDNESFKKQIESISKKYNVKLDDYKYTSSKALKIKNYYGTRILPFCVFKNKEVEIPFYSDNNDCTIEHIDEILNRYAKGNI